LRQSPRGPQWHRRKVKATETTMADRLDGTRILILETREEAQFSRLLT
jgi:hypothetical protein